MSDVLISQQAAIDALGEEPLVWHEDDAGEVAWKGKNQVLPDVRKRFACEVRCKHG